MNALSHNNYRTYRAALLGPFAALLALLLFVPAADAAAPCANESIREGQTSEVLPDGSVGFPACMALEMVSPQKKFNQYAIRPAIGLGGNRMVFASVGGLAETPKQGSIFDPYVASRTASGWTTHSPATPAFYQYGFLGTAQPCAYNTALTRWDTWASTSPQATARVVTAFQGGGDGLFEALSPTLAPLHGSVVPNFGGVNGDCAGGSADASRLFFSLGVVDYLPGDPVPSTLVLTQDRNNTYEVFHDQVGAPKAVLVARDKDGKVWGARCGTTIGGFGRRGSVSADASRVFFSTRPTQPEGPECDKAANKLRILERTRSGEEWTIDEPIASECDRLAPPCSTADSNDVYQGASQEGTRILFTTSRQLADSDLDTTNDLYLYDSTRPAGERLTQLSAGDGTDPTPGEGAEVLGVSEFAGDASHIYFVAKGALTTAANEAGDSAQPGQPNLYAYEYPSEIVRFVGTLSSSDTAVWTNGPGKNSANAAPTLGPDPEDISVGGDGHVLAFQTTVSLNSEDTDGGRSDIYRYDSSDGSLQLVSKAAPGGSGNGPFDVERINDAAQKLELSGPQTLSFARWVSGDGKTIVFETEEALDPTDTNGKANAYIWHEGEVTAIPFGEAPTVSPSGNEVAFVSDRKLLPEDGDGAKDIYLLRTDGGFAPPVPPVPCEAEACQGPPAPKPQDQGAASEAVRAGNPPQPPACKKGFARKKGRCVKAHGKAKKQRKHQSKASNRRGGAK